MICKVDIDKQEVTIKNIKIRDILALIPLLWRKDQEVYFYNPKIKDSKDEEKEQLLQEYFDRTLIAEKQVEEIKNILANVRTKSEE